MRLALNVALFCAFFALPLFILWLRSRRWGLPVRVNVDPHDPQPDDICEYFAVIARRLDEKPERMRIVFDGRNDQLKAISLSLDTDGVLQILVEGHRARRVDLRGRWIADHPAPMSLTNAVLYVEPVDANRFRVMCKIPFEVPGVVYAACSLFATIGLVCLSAEILLPAIGLCCGCVIATCQTDCR